VIFGKTQPTHKKMLRNIPPHILLLLLPCFLATSFGGFRDTEPPPDPPFIRDFFEAAEEGTATDLQTFLDQGADVNARNRYKKTPLHYAACNPDAAVLKLLIENGADVNAEDDEGRTPLDLAGYNDEKRDVLLEAGGKSGE